VSPTESLLTYASPKLGDVPYGRGDVLHFAAGLPGFEGLREFLLVTREECAPFVFLASLENAEVALPLLPWALAAGPHAALLVPAMPPNDDGAAVVCYAVVSIGPQGREVIANLRAPVIVNLDDRTGRQLILPDECVPLTARVGG
jgi:flagellar assembly factor FliW